jgi:hypothetical protein
VSTPVHATARAAMSAYVSGQIMLLFETERIEPLGTGAPPVTSAHYRLAYGTCRVPGRGQGEYARATHTFVQIVSCIIPSVDTCACGMWAYGIALTYARPMDVHTLRMNWNS